MKVASTVLRGRGDGNVTLLPDRLLANEPTVARWFKAKTERPGAVKGKQVVELMRRLAKALWHLARGRAFRAERLFDQHAVAGA